MKSRSNSSNHQDLTALGILLFVAATLSLSPNAYGQRPGQNIETKSGFLNKITENASSVKYVTLHPPKQGIDYEIKVNFVKAEIAAKAIDKYFDSLSEAAEKKGEDSGSAGWNLIREGLKYVDSEAEFEVFDTGGKSIGKKKDLGTTTFMRTIKFTARSSAYRVEVRCTEGAGLFHLTFEYD